MTSEGILLINTGKKRFSKAKIIKQILYPQPKLKAIKIIKEQELINRYYFPIIDQFEKNNLELSLAHDGDNYCLTFDSVNDVVSSFKDNIMENGIPISTNALNDFEVIRIDFGDKILSINIFELLKFGWEFDIDIGTNDDRVSILGLNVPILILQRSFLCLQGNEQVIIDLRNQEWKLKHTSDYEMRRISAIVECSDNSVLARSEKNEILELNCNLEFEEFDLSKTEKKLIDEANTLWSNASDPWEGTIWY